MRQLGRCAASHGSDVGAHGTVYGHQALIKLQLRSDKAPRFGMQGIHLLQYGSPLLLDQDPNERTMRPCLTESGASLKVMIKVLIGRYLVSP